MAEGYGKRKHVDDELFNSIAQFDPTAAAQLRPIQKDPDALARALPPIFARAIQKAPDTAVLAFSSVQQNLLSPKSDPDLSRCVAGREQRLVCLRVRTCRPATRTSRRFYL